jgi:hypothetical protein
MTNLVPTPHSRFFFKKAFKKLCKILRVTQSLYKFKIVIQNLIQIWFLLSFAYVFLSKNPAIILGLELKNSAAMRLMMYLALPRD